MDETTEDHRLILLWKKPLHSRFFGFWLVFHKWEFTIGVREMSSQLFVILYTQYIYQSTHKQLRRHLPNPFANSPVCKVLRIMLRPKIGVFLGQKGTRAKWLLNCWPIFSAYNTYYLLIFILLKVKGRFSPLNYCVRNFHKVSIIQMQGHKVLKYKAILRNKEPI